MPGNCKETPLTETLLYITPARNVGVVWLSGSGLGISQVVVQALNQGCRMHF